MTSIVLIIVSIIGAVGTYFAAHNLRQGVVKASALLAVIVGGFFYLFPSGLSPELSRSIPLAFIGATFVGMTGKNIIGNIIPIALAGAFFGVLFVYSAPFYNGFGGGLGTTACISVLITRGILYLLPENKKGA